MKYQTIFPFANRIGLRGLEQLAGGRHLDAIQSGNCGSDPSWLSPRLQSLLGANDNYRCAPLLNNLEQQMKSGGDALHKGYQDEIQTLLQLAQTGPQSMKLHVPCSNF